MLKIEEGENNDILRHSSVPISKIEDEHLQLIAEMKETMQKADGVGLAAPQVGRNIRLAIVTLSDDKKREMIAIINPEIIDFSTEQICMEEGCLSLPGQFQDVERSSEITLRYTNADGKDQLLRLKGMNARVVQHEIDHLDGILFIDRVTDSKTSVLDKFKKKLYL